MRYLIPLTMALLLLTPAASFGDEREADHQALRQLLAAATASLNEQRFDDLEPLLAPQFSLTFLDQTVVTDVDTLKATFARWLAPETGLESVTFAPEPSDKTQFTGPQTGFVTGVSRDHYRMRDGREGVMPAQWTATVVKHDGQWKISTLHAGVDPQDNAILDIILSSTRNWLLLITAITAVLALLAGLMLGRMLRR